VAGLLKRAGRRLYEDFLRLPQWGAYRQMLAALADAGYTFCSLRDFWSQMRVGRIDPQRKYLVLRHDVDVDREGAWTMLAIERKLGIASSYFFRLSTVDVPLMLEIDHSGGEASYHYEELAAVVKARRLRSIVDARAHIPCAQQLFRAHIERLRCLTGLPMSTVASHGDFANRRLAICNWVILQDQAFRNETGIQLEAYDDALLRNFARRYSDAPHPRFDSTHGPLAEDSAVPTVVQLLVHPRHWGANRPRIVLENAKRVWEELAYTWGGRPRGSVRTHEARQRSLEFG
jgi:hypothetical protein